MSRWTQVVLALVVLFAGAQLVRPHHTNPPIDAARTIQAHLGAESELGRVLDRSCGDCHSNATVWPWYAQVAPLSWLMAYSVREGRRVMNFSEWAAYPPEMQKQLLLASCRAASAGKMPGAYVMFRPETRLSAHELEMICAATREPQASAAVATPK